MELDLLDIKSINQMELPIISKLYSTKNKSQFNTHLDELRSQRQNNQRNRHLALSFFTKNSLHSEHIRFVTTDNNQ